MTSSRTPSPASSPSLDPIDSSPPSSPTLTAIRTPPGSPGVRDPFAGSTKSVKNPRIYERHGSKKSVCSIDAFDVHPDAFTRPEIPDATPSRPTRVVDPFSGSAKRHWRPPTYEKKEYTTNAVATASPSPSSPRREHSYRYSSPTPAIIMDLPDPDDDFTLTDDEFERAGSSSLPPSKAELEHELWDRQITAAIEKLHGVIDLSGTSLGGHITHIPPSIEELAIRTVLPQVISPTSVPPSPTLPPTVFSSNLPLATSPRPFVRATTVAAPAFNAAFFRSKDGERLRGTPAAARAASLQALAEQPMSKLRRPELHMYLANNTIPSLPPELFRVTTLTVLSLRSNLLRCVPPQIIHLTALQELNVAQNKLQWLPAEMLNMRLTKLTLTGNPWFPPPTSDHAASEKPTSDNIVRFSVTPLTELCLRTLLARPGAHPPSQPGPSTGSAQDTGKRHLTVLEASYDLPLTEEHDISPALLQTLRVCVPAAVARPAENQTRTKRRREDERSHSSEDVFGPSPDSAHPIVPTPAASPELVAPGDVTGCSICPSPMHKDERGEWLDGRAPVFVRPAEERFTWEDVIAGVRVAGEGGGGVPVRWRGCSRGCLAFLNPPQRERTQDVQPPLADSQPAVDASLPERGAAAGAGALELELGSDGDDDDVEMEDVRFDGALADLGDFEEAF